MALFARTALFALAGHVATGEQPIATVLLQLRAEVMAAEEWTHNDSHKAIAAHATISDWGYEKVAATKSNHEMELFIRRNLEEADLKIVDDHEDDLKAMIPRYSGEVATQSLEALHKELAIADWVTYKRLLNNDENSTDSEDDSEVEVQVSPGANASANLVALKACRNIRLGNYLHEGELARIIVARELHRMPDELRNELIKTLDEEGSRIVLQTGKGSVRFFTVQQLIRMVDRGTFHLLADNTPEEMARNAERNNNNGKKSIKKKTKRLARLRQRVHEGEMDKKDELKEVRRAKKEVAREKHQLKKIDSQIKALGKDHKQRKKGAKRNHRKAA
jgi:hypothetical protein